MPHATRRVPSRPAVHEGRGVALIRDLLTGNRAVLLFGPSGVGKLPYCVDLAKEFLEEGENVIFVTVEAHPDDLRAAFERSGFSLDGYEGEKLVFVDCYSSIAGREPCSDPIKKCLHVSSLSNLEQIGMNITKAAEWLGPPTRVFFHSFSPLFFHNSPQALAKFFQIISAQIRSKYGFAAYALHEGVHDSTTVHTLRMFVDGVVEMRFNENLRREMRIHHMKGLEVNGRWISFQVGDIFVVGSDDRTLERRFSEAELRLTDGSEEAAR